MRIIPNIVYNITPILEKNNLTLSERVLLKKTAGFYDFYSRYMEPSYTPKWLEKSIEDANGITMFLLKNNYGLYHDKKYKPLRESLKNLFEQNGLKKLANAIIKFDYDGKEHLKAADLSHIERITKNFSSVLKDEKLKEKISRILAKYL